MVWTAWAGLTSLGWFRQCQVGLDSGHASSVCDGAVAWCGCMAEHARRPEPHGRPAASRACPVWLLPQGAIPARGPGCPSGCGPSTGLRQRGSSVNSSVNSSSFSSSKPLAATLLGQEEDHELLWVEDHVLLRLEEDHVLLCCSLRTVLPVWRVRTGRLRQTARLLAAAAGHACLENTRQCVCCPCINSVLACGLT